jgi:hypothetical protein
MCDFDILTDAFAFGGVLLSLWQVILGFGARDWEFGSSDGGGGGNVKVSRNYFTDVWFFSAK